MEAVVFTGVFVHFHFDFAERFTQRQVFGERDFPELGIGDRGAIHFAFRHHQSEIRLAFHKRYAFTRRSQHSDRAGTRLAEHGFRNTRVLFVVVLARQTRDRGDNGIRVFIFQIVNVCRFELLVLFQHPKIEQTVAVHMDLRCLTIVDHFDPVIGCEIVFAAFGVVPGGTIAEETTDVARFPGIADFRHACFEFRVG